MTPALAAAFCFLCYGLAYRFYARFLATRVFHLQADRTTPAHALQDGVDYVPSRPIVLFGHHYASITGLAPMLGPAVAVIWGWAPALLWVMEGRRKPEAVVKNLERLRCKGIEVIVGAVTKIDVENRRVETEAGGFDFDALVIALGAETAPEMMVPACGWERKRRVWRSRA